MRLFKEELKKVEAFAFDVDGVFSRHEMNITPEGDLIRTSCTKDGYAMMYCTKKGYPVCIISGGQAPGVRERFEKLGVKDVYLGVANKVEALNEFLQKYNLNPENVLDKMIGDIEPSSDKLPVLLKKYILLNGRIVGFNIDPKFNMCLDGLLILDLFDVPMSTIESLSKEINDDTILNRFSSDNLEV